MQPWLLPAAALVIGSGGIATLLGLLVQRRQNNMVNSAAILGIAMDGLKTRIADQRDEINAKDARIAYLEAQLARRPRRTT